MEATNLIKVILPISLFIIMLGMGLSLKPLDFKIVMIKPKAVLFGVLAQMVLLPVIAYLIVLSFSMTGAIAVGFMILALCPGGTTSNLYTYLANGDIALSVTLTSIVSLIAPFTVPVLIVMFMGVLMGEEAYIELPVLKTIAQLIVITIIPICIGMFVNFKKPSLSKKAEKPVKIFSVVFLFLVVAMVIKNNWEAMGGYFAQIGLAAFVLNITCMLLGYLLARFAYLNVAQSKAISIEVGFQNGTLALLIALTLLENSAMAIAATCYSIIMFVTGALFAGFWSKRT
ncbi:bile acid:sodium symporter family protein [Oceaniserpentilla sp. 4NH20-0058]|uniref:bile acid:sodium symporter family protein n=1 Tax=Oceaniserpentilla sp. 4NH20-0058 TaxID=3127660 RepID=UPI00310433F7